MRENALRETFRVPPEVGNAYTYDRPVPSRPASSRPPPLLLILSMIRGNGTRYIFAARRRTSGKRDAAQRSWRGYRILAGTTACSRLMGIPRYGVGVQRTKEIQGKLAEMESRNDEMKWHRTENQIESNREPTTTTSNRSSPNVFLMPVNTKRNSQVERCLHRLAEEFAAMLHGDRRANCATGCFFNGALNVGQASEQAWPGGGGGGRRRGGGRNDNESRLSR